MPSAAVESTTEPLVALGAPERRQAAFDSVEIRQDGESLVFVGHAAVFDRLSDDLGGFKERIQRGAFRKVLDTNPDVRFLSLDHQGLPLARTAAGTMELSEDPRGLRVYADLAPIQASRDLRVLIQRGDLSQMSFGFTVGAAGRDVWQEEDGEIVRTIVSFGALYDVSPVSFPAYQQTDASMRSQACGIEIVAAGEVQERVLRELAQRIHRGELEATEEERGRIDAAFARLDTVSPWMAQRALMAVSQEPELRGVIPGKVATVELTDAGVGGVPYRLAARRRRLRALGVQLEESRQGDPDVVHLLRTMLGLANQYMANKAEADEGDDDVQAMAGIASELDDLLTDELEEPS